MTLIDDLEKRKKVLQQRIHTLQNWPGKLQKVDRQELDRCTQALAGVTKHLEKMRVETDGVQ
jgi:hypothetical protein